MSFKTINKKAIDIGDRNIMLYFKQAAACFGCSRNRLTCIRNKWEATPFVFLSNKLGLRCFKMSRPTSQKAFHFSFLSAIRSFKTS